jgi:osmoprotectant transport system permease protein
MKRWFRTHVALIVYGALFWTWIVRFEWFRTSVLAFLPERSNVILRVSLLELALQHLNIVFISSSIAFMVAMSLALSVHLLNSKEYRHIIIQLATLGETLPTVTLIALSVPLLGYGNAPLILALSLYGVLPILRNTLTGLETLPKSIQEASLALGLTNYQRLLRIEIPLVMPHILSGLRISTIINVSAATIGSAVGAGGFGVLIISGIRSYNPLFIIQGSIPVILMALFFDRLLRPSSQGF